MCIWYVMYLCMFVGRQVWLSVHNRHVWVCMYVCMHVTSHVCKYALYIYIYIYIYIIYIYIYIYIYDIHESMYTWIYVYMYMKSYDVSVVSLNLASEFGCYGHIFCLHYSSV